MNNTSDVDQINQQAWALRIADPHQAIADALRAQFAAQNLAYQNGNAQSLSILGHCYHRIGDYEQASTHAARALALFEELNDREGQADALNTIGNINSALGDHHTAVTYYLRSLSIRQAIGNQQAEAGSWNTIGNMDFHVGDYSSALDAHHMKNVELSAALANADRQRKIAEDANRFKTKLLSVVAHDLRNPLNVISGYAELLLFQLPSDSPMCEIIENIQLGARRIEHLLKSLLESAIIEDDTFSLQLRQLDLAYLAQQVVDMNQERARHKSQTFHVDAELRCIVAADEDRMWQILDNIVNNAIKFSPPKKHIWVSVTHQGQCIRCAVRDQGSGLTEEDKRRLFGRLERLSATPTGGEHTTGLGLSIVKQLVELHGGQVWAESLGPDQGSTFIVELPAIVFP